MRQKPQMHDTSQRLTEHGQNTQDGLSSTILHVRRRSRSADLSYDVQILVGSHDTCRNKRNKGRRNEFPGRDEPTPETVPFARPVYRRDG